MPVDQPYAHVVKKKKKKVQMPPVDELYAQVD
jgi:hypothetical protein